MEYSFLIPIDKADMKLRFPKSTTIYTLLIEKHTKHIPYEIECKWALEAEINIGVADWNTKLQL